MTPGDAFRVVIRVLGMRAEARAAARRMWLAEMTETLAMLGVVPFTEAA